MIHHSLVESLVGKARELRFLSTERFRPFDQYFCPESVHHPTKTNLYLLMFLIREYTKGGDVIIDPMCGVGSTIVIANLLRRNGIGLEYEAEYCSWSEKNLKLVRKQKRSTYSPKGVIIHGDARDLSALLNLIKGGIEWCQCKVKRKLAGLLRICLHCGRFVKPEAKEGWEEFRLLLSILGRTVIPNSLFEDEFVKDLLDIWRGDFVDSVIMSPPYASQNAMSNKCGWSESYRHAFKEFMEKKYRRKFTNRSYLGGAEKGFVISNDPRNIGNLPYEEYLKAMAGVYRECYSILKEGGSLITIVRNFIRRRQVVDLTFDTYDICEGIGFRIKSILKFRLSKISFWRSLYYKRFEDVERILHEYILVFYKP